MSEPITIQPTPAQRAYIGELVARRFNLIPDVDAITSAMADANIPDHKQHTVLAGLAAATVDDRDPVRWVVLNHRHAVYDVARTTAELGVLAAQLVEEGAGCRVVLVGDRCPHCGEDVAATGGDRPHAPECVGAAPAAGVNVALRHIGRDEAARRWEADQLVGVTYDRYPDGWVGAAMRPGEWVDRWADFDAMAADVNRQRRGVLYFWAPADGGE